MTCGCGRARVHEDTGKCRYCWQEELALSWDEFPDGDTINHAYVAINVQVGDDVRIHPLATVGTRPFEFVRDGDRVLGFPKTGSVVLGNRVEVFPHANVDLGFLGDTVVGHDTKIDRYTNIGHNSVIGERCLLCAGTVLGGHVRMGNDVFVGMRAVIKQRVTIGDGAYIGMGAVVCKDVPAGAHVAGNPAKILKVEHEFTHV